jgi:surface polysaccharide O-acyltransferase-like enzyme
MERIKGFDLLRFLMIVCVVMLHGAVSYMVDPPISMYAESPDKSIIFSILALLLDSFPMTVLFFLSGYFTPAVFEKRERAAFFKNKAIHIVLPFVLGVALVTPFLEYARESQGTPGIPFNVFLKDYFGDPPYPQGPYWFLMILFVFYLLYPVLKPVLKCRYSPMVNGRRTCVKFAQSISRPLLCVLAIFVLATGSYILSALYVGPAGEWFNATYVLNFQAARIVGYLLMFLFGAAVYLNGWLEKLAGPVLWGCLTAGCMVALVIQSGAPNVVTEAIFYNAVSICMTMSLLSVFVRIPSTDFLRHFEKQSFGLYWFHQITLMPLIYLLIPLRINIGAKWALAVAATIFVGTLLTMLVKLIVRSFLKQAQPRQQTTKQPRR